ncbi:MAG TPA: hypothetical protein DET40_18595 [Lentisphaeria bacterium]|nr:MAG: hypothetical protein A2X45_10915 [Lentisphaerae bacterium GWF2_50_93]HCE45554.1 hypothetical protein [Lentisphaeria bacterium]
MQAAKGSLPHLQITWRNPSSNFQIYHLKFKLKKNRGSNSRKVIAQAWPQFDIVDEGIPIN